MYDVNQEKNRDENTLFFSHDIPDDMTDAFFIK